MKLNILIDDENTEEIVDKITIRILQVATSYKNYKILMLLPDNIHKSVKINDIMKKVGLTKVPVNSRINALEKCGLLRRELGTNLVFATEMTFVFKSLFNQQQEYVKDHISDMISKKLDYF